MADLRGFTPLAVTIVEAGVAILVHMTLCALVLDGTGNHARIHALPQLGAPAAAGQVGARVAVGSLFAVGVAVVGEHFALVIGIRLADARARSTIFTPDTPVGVQTGHAVVVGTTGYIHSERRDEYV